MIVTLWGPRDGRGNSDLAIFEADRCASFGGVLIMHGARQTDSRAANGLRMSHLVEPVERNPLRRILIWPLPGSTAIFEVAHEDD